MLVGTMGGLEHRIVSSPTKSFDYMILTGQQIGALLIFKYIPTALLYVTLRLSIEIWNQQRLVSYTIGIQEQLDQLLFLLFMMYSYVVYDE